MDGREDERTGNIFSSVRGELYVVSGTEDLWMRMLEKQILIRDCSNYTGLSKGDYRVAVKTREENEQLFQALKEAY